jgi:hypothetical protein
VDPRFLKPTPSHHELILLLAIHRRGRMPMPLNPQELPPAVLQQVPLSRLLDEGLVAITGDGAEQALALTAEGLEHLRWLVIDYHLELMDLRRASKEFVAERVHMLEQLGCARILLYGASDTARVLLECLKDSSIEVLAVLDDDARKHGSRIEDTPVVSPSDLSAYDFDSVVVTTVAFQDAILQRMVGTIPPGKRHIGLFDDFQG